MATGILGPTRSRRRRRFLLGPIFLAVLVALFATAGAQAVHDLELFELDRDALDDGAVAGDDWDTLFGGGGSQDAFTGILPDIETLTDDGDQFTGGGSKDDLDITSWLWKEGEPLDKDNLTNAYAASYTNTVDTGENDVGDLIIYFGLDRFSTAGSAQVGFWFLQDPDFGLTDTPSGGGMEFSGQHRDNDVLVQSNFTNGGVLANLTVYRWVAGALVQVGSATNDCVTSAPDDDAACATVNVAPTDAPWPYAPKPNEGPPGTFQRSAFFEGGINISRLVPEATCFANFLAETRSSTPFDATLKDFVQGEFEECEAEITTTPSAASIQLGESITDTAVVQGNGLNPPTPTGFVKFFICSPSELTNGTCADGTGTFVDVGGDEPDGEALTPDPNDATKANAESDAFTPDAVGTWCWRGEYSGDDFYDPVADSSTGECFTVTDTSSTSTAQDWRPNDSATVTSTGGSPLAGSVAFTLYNNGTCDGTVLYTETRPVSGASPQTVSTTNDGSAAGDVLVSASATVSWRAVFTSTDGNVEGSTAPCESTVLTIDNDITNP